jgi:hypothetical protein
MPFQAAPFFSRDKYYNLKNLYAKKLGEKWHFLLKLMLVFADI